MTPRCYVMLMERDQEALRHIDEYERGVIDRVPRLNNVMLRSLRQRGYVHPVELKLTALGQAVLNPQPFKAMGYDDLQADYERLQAVLMSLQAVYLSSQTALEDSQTALSDCRKMAEAICAYSTDSLAPLMAQMILNRIDEMDSLERLNDVVIDEGIF